ncbi:unnamed protein product [Enterobius vermicularis]|uniref:B30.2/SPRY domain-containing protein n=1 Tax=Enterobius vermicularis TaxID=51028 RepID=A0A0N4V979_ENTVE|nr:unnamed protein product [Enterobius vermicularis]
MRQKNRKEVPRPISSDGRRELGMLELFCAGCRKWFHGRCLRDLKDLIFAVLYCCLRFNYGLPFMVCYVFNCSECSSTKKESWTAKQANFAHMCVTVLANLTFGELQRRAGTGNVPNDPLSAPIYFNFEKEIIPFFNSQWENLTSMTRRVKNTWHQTLLKTLAKENELFESSEDGQSFALKERDLLAIGPVHEALKQIGRNKPSSTSSTRDLRESVENSDDPFEGPKTRGSSKRRNIDGGVTVSKKSKNCQDLFTSKASKMSTIEFPFNRDGYRYYLVTKDESAPFKEVADEQSYTGKPIPAHTYRIVTHPYVTLSPNDRAHELKLSDDRLTVTGFEGYRVARATHSVSHGSWHYEVTFVSQPEDSHIRIGWSQALSPVQACAGYTQFSYAWRSLHGTRFHEGKGKRYHVTGFKEGDVLGCLISFPLTPADKNFNFSDCSALPSSSSYLPCSHKDLPLIHYKHNYFYEEKDDAREAAKNLMPLPGSYIEFFKNGVSCGVAFRDVYAGFYFPAISLYHNATVRCNFGPRLKYPVPGAKPMSDCVLEQEIERVVSDLLYHVDNEEKIIEEVNSYRALS